MISADKHHANGAEQEALAGKRAIKSYVLRSGRLTTAQSKALESYWQDFVLDYQESPLDLTALFNVTQDTVVEIGFGMGDSLLEMASKNPQLNFIGIEVHRPGIGKLLDGLVKAGVSNVRIINHDASEVMSHCFSDNSLHKLQIYFPDPWHKKRHHKRRLIQPDFINLVTDKLQAEGLLHLATDWQPYAEYMLEVLGGCERLTNLAASGQYMEQTDRPVTKFEKRGLRLGHGVWDLMFKKTN